MVDNTSNAMSAIYTAWNLDTTGAPDTTMYASPIVSTYSGQEIEIIISTW